MFRLEPPNASLGLAQLNALNLDFYARLSGRQDVAFTRTDLNGIICVRCAVGAERTEDVHIQQAFGVLCDVADETLKAWDAEGEKDNRKETV